jgi:uncharacterized membrane protein
MIRKVFTGIAAFALMTGAAIAQDTYATRDDSGRVVVVHQPDPAKHAARGALAGGGMGALIGCLVTIPIGCAPGAAIGAAVGGGGGAVVGAASTPPPHAVYEGRRPADDRD